jgi:hypothetical protein
MASYMDDDVASYVDDTWVPTWMTMMWQHT